MFTDYFGIFKIKKFHQLKDIHTNLMCLNIETLKLSLILNLKIVILRLKKLSMEF
jgi:hypothetical protein